MNQHNQQDAIWDYFQNEAPTKFLGSLPRIKFLMKKLAPGQKVLNIGVGSGILEELALKEGLDIYSMDPVTTSIESLKERLKMGDKAKVGYGEAIPFEDNMFDVVIASEVLEHLTDESITASLGEIRRVLKPGGVFLGTVPARENLLDQMVVCPDCSKRFHRWGHEQSFTTSRMRELIAGYLKPETVEERLFIPFNILNFTGRLAGTLKLVMFKMGRNGSDQNVYFEGRKS